MRVMTMPDSTMVTSATTIVVPSLCCDNSLRADFDMRTISVSTRRKLRSRPASGANCQKWGKPPTMMTRFSQLLKRKLRRSTTRAVSSEVSRRKDSHADHRPFEPLRPQPRGGTFVFRDTCDTEQVNESHLAIFSSPPMQGRSTSGTTTAAVGLLVVLATAARQSSLNISAPMHGIPFKVLAGYEANPSNCRTLKRLA